MNVQVFVCNPFGENTYVVFDETKDAVIIDPGFCNEHELLKAKTFIAKEGLVVKQILNTHLHLDHCMGNGMAKREWGGDAAACEKDLFLLRGASEQARMFGLGFAEILPEPGKFLVEGDVVKIGNMLFDVLEVPGHSAGSLAFYERNDEALFVGDVLFRGSYGRTDLPGGDFDTLKHSIVDKLFKLPDEVTVFCGHGPSTVIGEEKGCNDILF